MRTSFLFLLCFQVIHADWLLDLMEEYTDNNIDPCDDFYKHTCGNTKTPTMSVTSKRFLEDIKDYEKGDTSGFDEIFKRLNSEKRVIDKQKTTLKERLCNYTTNFMPLLRNFIGSEEECSSYNYGVVEGSEEEVENLAKNVQVYNWMTENQLQEQLEVIFSHLKEMIREEINTTPWMNTYNVRDFILMKLDSYSVKNPNTGHENHFLTFGPVLVNECTTYNVSLRECLSTVASAYKMKYDLEFYFNVEYNAYYSVDFIEFFPPLYEFIYHKSTFSIFLLINTMAHELGHLVFYDIVDNRNVVEPSTLICVNEAMDNVCRIFTNGTRIEDYCGNKTDTTQEDIADFMDIMLSKKLIEYAYRSHLKSTMKKVDKEMAKTLLKAAGLIWCDEYTPDNVNPHSFGPHRVNLIAKQSILFQETFNCKPGDRMYTSPKEQCIVTGEEAPSTKKFIEETLYSHTIV